MSKMKIKTKYKYIYFERIAENEWLCKNNRSEEVLGYVDVYPQWKQFAFEPFEDCVFTISCLRDIIHFIEQIGGKGKPKC